jgi:hypothetical protein
MRQTAKLSPSRSPRCCFAQRSSWYLSVLAQCSVCLFIADSRGTYATSGSLLSCHLSAGDLPQLCILSRTYAIRASPVRATYHYEIPVSILQSLRARHLHLPSSRVETSQVSRQHQVTAAGDRFPELPAMNAFLMRTGSTDFCRKHLEVCPGSRGLACKRLFLHPS